MKKSMNVLGSPGRYEELLDKWPVDREHTVALHQSLAETKAELARLRQRLHEKFERRD